ncbi:MAG: glycerol-3-phosphate 1-O-acyltransferase PlsY [Oscillospiraceae bacterium]|nr:glycerol-3-phosphate 1-O-acyltransferase PlsY [Oscillospiraceae bacterium]
MHLFLCIAFAIIAPYLICSINPAIIITKIKSGEDIRTLGSGGAGLTNTLRTQGKTAAALVLLFDVLKGIISVLAVWGLYKLFWVQIAQPFSSFFRPALFGIFAYRHVSFFLWLAALSSVLGHCFPVYYKFKGGKAVLVTVATGLVINWLAALTALLVFIIIVAVTKYVSLGSIIAAAAYPVCVWFTEAFIWKNSTVFTGVFFSAVIAVILILMHRKNIKRLLNGSENKMRI